jgi:hypothetical protein
VSVRGSLTALPSGVITGIYEVVVWVGVQYLMPPAVVIRHPLPYLKPELAASSSEGIVSFSEAPLSFAAAGTTPRSTISRM